MQYRALGQRAWLTAWAALLVAAVACGSPTRPAVAIDAPAMDRDAGTGPFDGPDAGVAFPAFQPTVPQLVALASPARIIAHPVVQLAGFADDPELAALDGFVAAYVGSAVFASELAEYGVGAAMRISPLAFQATAPPQVNDSEVAAFVQSQLTAGTLDAEASAAIVVLYPAGTSVTVGGVDICRSGIAMYHAAIAMAGGATVNYAVVPRCDSGASTAGEPARTLARAMVAIATDPVDAGMSGGYAGFDPAHRAFGSDSTEVGAACAVGDTTIGGFTVSRVWSNAAAAHYHDPCLPAADGAYFNSAPIVHDPIDGTTGVLAPLHADTQVDVQLFSDAPTSGPWTVAVTASAGSPDLGGEGLYNLDRSTGRNGDVLHLTIHPMVAGSGVAEITSTLGAITNVWFLAVKVQ